MAIACYTTSLWDPWT